MESPLIREGLILPNCFTAIAPAIASISKKKFPRILFVDGFDNSKIRDGVWADYNEVMALPSAANDDHREIHELNNVEEDWSTQAFLLKEKAKNLPLGKHFHRNKIETFVIIEGLVEKLVTAPAEEPENRLEFAELVPGTIIIMPMEVAHTFYMQPGSRMICYSNKAFNPNDMDMIGVDLL